MPDNSNETARVLCTAGSWIKYLDPKRADPIYKTLVRRCRKTEIGWQADQMRWFPILDDSGNPVPNKPRTQQKFLMFEDNPGHFDFSSQLNYIGAIHMIDRQYGWAENVVTLLKTNEWIFEQNAIMRTTNGGVSWKSVLVASPPDSIAAFYNGDCAWISAVYDESTNVSILETIDGGKSWGNRELSVPYPVENCELSVPPESREQISLAERNIETIPASSLVPDQEMLLLIPDHGMSSMPGFLYSSDEYDYGDSWQFINSTENSENNWIDADGTEPGFADSHPYLICGGSIAFQDLANGWLLGQLTTTTRPFLFFTRDAGTNWQEQKFDLPPSLHDGSIVPQKLPEFFGSDGIVETSFVPNDRESTNVYDVFYETRNAGKTWQPTTPVKSVGAYSFISRKSGWVWCPQLHDSNSAAPAHGSLCRTDDGGRTWKPVHIKVSLENYLTHGQRLIQLDFVDDAYGWAIAQDWRNETQLLKTTDGGETWNVQTP